MTFACRTAASALLALLLAASASARPLAQPAAKTGPAGLHGFLLRADEPSQQSFTRTPSFAWNPVAGAVGYEFQLSTSSAFRDSGLVYEDDGLKTPVVAVNMTLPWITGSPHSLYARVRAVLQDSSTTAWSQGWGFDITPPPPPKPLSSYPGLLRWTPVAGAEAYQIWFVDVPPGEKVVVFTNVLDEREFFTFHQSPAWTKSIRWRIRAMRVISSDVNNKKAIDNRGAVTFGPWSQTYVSSNPVFQAGPIRLVGTVSDVFSNGDPASPAHKLMPAFLFNGNQAEDGTSAELFRVEIFTDKQCLNPVFVGPATGSPAYSPRPYGGPLLLPLSASAISAARTHYLAAGTEPPGVSFDGSTVVTNESGASATPTTSLPLTTGAGTSSAFLTWSAGTTFGAPIDLPDTDWPNSGYYWTVIPVAPEQPSALQTAVSVTNLPGAKTISVASSDGFQPGDAILIGAGAGQEAATVTAVGKGSLTLAAALTFSHLSGEPVVRDGGSIQYVDLEMPQDACAAGRVARFGKSSEPSLTSSGDLFASGLSATGRLTSAVKTKKFYGNPLVSWTPALGASAYQVQWSKSPYTFKAEPNPSATTPGAAGILTAATSALLPVQAGRWYYRVRGFDYSLPTGKQAMGWSDPVKIVVSGPSFTVVPPGSKPKPKHKP